jgi:hypothetical protein
VQSGTLTNINQNTNTANSTNTNINTDISNSTVNQTINSAVNSNNVNTNNSTNRNINDSTSSSVSTSSNLNTNVSSSTSQNINTNINTSTNASTSENVNNNNNVNVSDSKSTSYSENVSRQIIDQNLKSPPPSAIAPSMMSYSQDVCTTGVSGAVQTQIFGVSAGKAIRDSNCERLKLSAKLYDMGMRVAAVSLLCQDKRVFEAMWEAGTPCPFDGLIGDKAKAAWEQNPDQKPKK